MKKENAQLTDIAWLAGFMDGESHFRLAVNTRGGGAIYTRVGITNTEQRNIKKADRIVNVITGRPGRTIYRWMKDGRKPRYDLMIQAHDEVRRLCLAIQPYAVGKREHIKAMLKYLDMAPGHGGRKNGVSRFRAKHYALVTKMATLNRRYGPGEWSEARDQTAGSARRRMKKWPGLHRKVQRRQK